MLENKISAMMLASMTMTVAMVLTVTAWTAAQNNQTAAEDSMRMVAGGLQARIDRVASLNWDYSAWAAAFENTRARNTEWLTENMGSGANGNEFHVLQLVMPEDWSALTWTAETNDAGTAPTTEPVIPIEVVRQFLPALQAFERDVVDTQTFFLEIDDVVNIIAVSRVQPWGKATQVSPEMFPLNVFAYRMNSDFLSQVAETYLLENIALSEVPIDGHISMPLVGPDGSVLTRLQWIPPQPGNTLVRTASLPLAIGLIAFLTISGTVTAIARRNARKLVESEAEAVRIARIDSLTRLANRLALNEHITEMRRNGETVALLIIDLNSFKEVNDKYGHGVGDALIEKFANIIHSALHPDAFAARLGGDEFTIVTTGPDAEEHCLAMCDALRQETKEPLSIEGLSLSVSFALGYSVGNAAELRRTELLRRADIAMYHAKQGKAKTPVKYDSILEKDKVREDRTIDSMKSAMETFEEFEVVYQPIVSAKTGKLSHAEALLRWYSPELGAVSSDYFVPIAERTTLIVGIGRFVIKRVLSDLREFPSLRVSINLSPAQLHSPEIVKEIKCYADDAGIDPSRVTFEITETTLLQDEHAVLFITDALRDLGFRIALDDFGTGYSSIGYLRKIRFDELKVDKSFVDDIGSTDTGENLLTSLAFLARALGLEIVAEGVETEEQLKLLSSLSYDLLQGYLLSKPIPTSELSAFLADQADWSDILGTAYVAGPQRSRSVG